MGRRAYDEERCDLCSNDRPYMCPFSGCREETSETAGAGAASEVRGGTGEDGAGGENERGEEDGTGGAKIGEEDGAGGTEISGEDDGRAEGEASSGSVASEADGERILREIFPEEGYEIYADGRAYAGAACFEVEVGESCSGADLDEEIGVFDYTVGSKEDGYGWASCYVSEDGRVIGFGTLISEEDSNETYRLR